MYLGKYQENVWFLAEIPKNSDLKQIYPPRGKSDFDNFIHINVDKVGCVHFLKKILYGHFLAKKDRRLGYSLKISITTGLFSHFLSFRENLVIFQYFVCGCGGLGRWVWGRGRVGGGEIRSKSPGLWVVKFHSLFSFQAKRIVKFHALFFLKKNIF